MLRIIFFIIAISFISSCTKEDNGAAFPSRVKTLELNRSSQPQVWRSLLLEAADENQQALVIDGAAKVKSAALIPFFRFVLDSLERGPLLTKAYWGLGQTKDPRAEALLLAQPFDLLTIQEQETLLSALALCGTKNSLDFLYARAAEPKLKRLALQTLAILARRKISRHTLPADSSQSLAYYLNYTASYRDIPFLSNLVGSGNYEDDAYLLRKLVAFAKKDSARFKRTLLQDSTARPKLLAAIPKTLKKSVRWQTRLRAIELVPFMGDSVLSSRVLSFVNSNNPHIRLAAIRSAVQLSSNEKAQSLLLEQLQKVRHNYLRAKLLALLAGVNPQSAFRLIMKDLDKRDDNYKAWLLDALAATKQKEAYRTLHQFVQIPNALLSDRAFNNLVAANRVSRSDIKSLLTSESFSSVSLALDYETQRHRSQPLETLLQIYKRFNHPAEFEAQRSVIKMLAQKKSRLDSTVYKTLWEEAAHPVVYGDLHSAFPAAFSNSKSAVERLTFLPSFLQPDSLPAYPKNPTVTIVTDKGEIKAELDGKAAPVTVTNFLHLAGNGFYNGLNFHRVIADFVVQGGDPSGDGWGGTDYLVPSEDTARPFERGSIGIATSGYDTGSCQFFICHSKQPHLTGNYTNFGKVIAGMDIVDQILPGDKIIKILIEKE